MPIHLSSRRNNTTKTKKNNNRFILYSKLRQRQKQRQRHTFKKCGGNEKLCNSLNKKEFINISNPNNFEIGKVHSGSTWFVYENKTRFCK